MDVRVQEIVQAQAALRFLNERVELLAAETPIGDDPHAAALIRCECGRADCAQTITLRRREYEAIRLDPRRFLVAPGHGVAGVEAAVVLCEGFDVVETLSDAADLAESFASRAG